MERRLIRSIATTAMISVATTGCHASMAQSPSSGPTATLPEGRHTNVGAEWPLKFEAHYFGGHCFDTQSCVIVYRGFRHGSEDSPSPSVASYGRPLDKLLSAGRGPIPNFPPPAHVTWRSKDGAPLEAEIDIGEIFGDELVRHHLKQDEISEQRPGPGLLPAIIIEINDRTINVYMRAHISTKELQESGNRYSDFRNDLIKVLNRTY